MLSVESVVLLVVAPLAGAAAWLVAARGRGRRLRRASAAVSATLLVAALAGLTVQEGGGLRVFLVDVSGSMRGAGAARLPRVRAAAASAGEGAQVAVVAFGRDATVLLRPTPADGLPSVLPDPVGVDQEGTCIEAALRTGLALFPEGTPGDLVLVTDGVQTHGDATTEAAKAAASGRPVHALPLATGPEKDAWVAAVRAPSVVPAGAALDFEIVAGATAPMHGKLVLLLDGRELARPEPVDVLSGQAAFARRVAGLPPGWHTVTARLICPGDVTSENDTASAAVRVSGTLSVAVVSAGGERRLGRVLAARPALAVRAVAPGALTPGNEGLLRTDVVVLDDVPADQLGAERIAWLGRFVIDAGRGLVVFGGRNAFGAGGYAGTGLAGLLPVDPDPERRAARPTSVAIVADRSGSMAETVGGRQKIEFVREAVLRAAGEFRTRAQGHSDELTVVAFSHKPDVLLERVRVGTPEGAKRLREVLGELFPAGRTRIGPALDAALGVVAESDLRRHVILVSDGLSRDALDGAALAKKMKGRGAVLSVLATSSSMNDGLLALKAAAEATEGRFVMLASITELPAAMARETRAIAGSLVREGEFAAEPGEGAWPGRLEPPRRVTGYVVTGEREEAPSLLVVSGAPLLAAWRRGLGRVVACTTSLDEWAPEWAAADPGAFERLVLWAGAAERQPQLAVEVEHEDGRLIVTATSAGPLEGTGLAASVLAPGGAVVESDMRRVGLSRHTCTVAAEKRGVYLVKVSERGSGEVLGEGHAVVDYSPEWRPGGDAALARRIARVTSGVVLEDLAELPPLEQRAGAGAARSVAWVLLCLAVGAFLVSLFR